MNEPTEVLVTLPAAELCDRLRVAVEDAASRDADSMRALHNAVAEFTATLRDAGTTPEAVLIRLKSVINDRSFVEITPHASDWSGHHLRERMSTWCIEEFFREKTA